LYPRLLLPPDSFRVSLDRFKEFVAMDKDEQKQAKKDFTRLTKSTKQALSTHISGQPCSCCARKARTDKGQRRGANARSRGTSRLIRRSNRANINAGSKPPAATTDLSLGHSAARRQPAADTHKAKRKYYRQLLRRLECARSKLMQGGETAMQQIHETMKRLITAMSLSVKKSPTCLKMECSGR
jgi:hypothetical protein